MPADDHNPHIKAYAHCRKCMAELPADQSPRSWARIEVGLTDAGCVVWCVRHDCAIVEVAFDDKPTSLPRLPRTTSLPPLN